MAELPLNDKIAVMEERLRDAAFALDSNGVVSSVGSEQARIAGDLYIGLCLQQVAKAVTDASRRSGI